MNHQHSTQWFLVSNCGANISLPQTMLSLGREGCDVILQSRSVDKRHAVVTYDHYEKRFKVKDLNSINGTYLNNARIPSHTFVKVEHLDWLRFGFVVYQVQAVERIHASVSEYPNQLYGNWASLRQFPQQQVHQHASMKMAECQGCLHKQNIQHTCGIKGEEWELNQQQQQFRTHGGSGVAEPNTVVVSLSTSVAPSQHAPVSTLTSTTRQDFCGNVVSQNNSSSWPTDRNIDSNSHKLGSNQVNQSGGHSNQCHYGQQPHIGLISSLQSCVCYGPQGTSYPQGVTKSFVSPVIQSQSLFRSEVSPLRGLKSPDTSGNSQISNFSGDSLDLQCDTTSKSMASNEQQSSANDSIDSKLNSNGLDSQSNTSNVMKAEKPYVSDDSADRRAPSFCPQSGDGSDTKVSLKSASVETDGGKASRQSCTAFTIEFDDGSAAKKLDIKDSISKFAPPKLEAEIKSTGHRRNLSLSKVEELKVLENFSDENGNTDKKRQFSLDCEENTKKVSDSASEVSDCSVPPASSARLRLAGYLSEGHLSSDQDDDMSAKSDPTKKGGKVSQEVARLMSEVEKSSKNGANVRQSLPVGLGDSAKYLINKMFGAVTAPPTSPSDPTKVFIASSRCEKDQTPPEMPLTKNDLKTGSHTSLLSTATYLVNNGVNNKSHVASRAKIEQQEDVKELYLSEEDVDDVSGDSDDLEDGTDGDRVRDDVSESGTYTIEKDEIDSVEVEARQNIDCVFGVSTEQNSVKNACNGDNDMEFEGVELRRKTPESELRGSNTVSRKATPNWLKEWVAQSATSHSNATVESLNSRHTIQGTPVTCGLPPAHSGRLVSEAPEVPQRLRRKLPVLPVDKSPSPLTLSSSPLREGVMSSSLDRMVSPSSHIAKSKASNSSSRASPDGRRSDSSMDTETILKDTETVVSAMEARIDKRASRQKGPIVTISSLESRDSGGESDLDTSTASPVNEIGHRNISKKLNAQLKAQLRVLDDGNRSGNASAKSVRSSTSSGIHFSAKDGGSSSSHGHNTPTGDYADNISEVETASIHSDLSSSSDLSASSPGLKRKGGDRPPIMRFNRAFSLRRARLGCESDGAHSAPVKRVSVGPVMSPSSRPGSAGSVGSGKDRNGSSGKRNSTSIKSESGTSSAGTPNAANLTPTASSFSRNDGGRFSLRLPRSAGVPLKPPAKAASQGKPSVPKAPRTNVVGGSNSKTAPNPRSNSTMSAKELEMKNWKRRKEYDPLKAAAEGRKKVAAHKSVHGGLSQSTVMSKSESPSPTGMAFHRSASFHGTDGLMRRDTFVCEDQMALSLEDDDEGCSDTNNRSPTCSDPLATMYENSDMIYRSRLKKSSEDDSTSEATRTMSHTDLASDVMNTSPRGSPSLHPVLRHKSKIDALDNLVISAVHQLSCNLRGTTENILRKVSELHGPECEQIFGNNGFEELLSKLTNAESPVSSPQGRTVSKQLAGILKNMKRLEESLQSIDRVMDLVPIIENGSQKLNGGGKGGGSDPQTEAHRSKVVTSTSRPQQHKNKWNGFNGREYY